MAVIGIDLGTTYSSCAVFKDNHPIIIPNALGEYLTPSIVGISQDNTILVGASAEALLDAKKYNQVAKSFKRYMGTPKKFYLSKKQFSSEELSSLVLAKLKEDAEIFLNTQVTSAVISVPAYFNNKQRQATKIAGELAGLKVERLINEPTAAALHYGLINLKQATKYLVFDIGGGTFDVSIIELFNGVVEIRATAGDNYLGGDDFTNLLSKHIIIKQGYNVNTLTENELMYFWKQAEILKKKLNNQEQASINMEFDKKNLNIVITRKEVDELYTPLLNQMLNPIRRALGDAKLRPDELDAILLVGGSTKLHMIPKLCAKIFKKIPFSYNDPQLVVALGAAVQTELQANNSSLKEMVLTDVSAYSLGIAAFIKNTEETEYCPIIERNTILPTSIVQNFYSVYDNQQYIQIEIFQGESRKVENNILIGTMKIELPLKVKKNTLIQIRFTYNVNGILEVQANLPDYDINKTEIFRESCGNLTEEEIKLSMDKLKSLKIHPREQEENIIVILKAEQLYEETLGETRNVIAAMIREFQMLLESQNIKLIQEYRLKLIDFLQSIDKYCYE